MQMENMEKFFGVLRELQDDSREYLERLDEIREGLGNVRQQRNASALRQKGKSVVGAPPLEVYRTSRSRSTTAFEGSDAPVTSERKTWSDEDGDVGDDLSTCGEVIKRLMPKYRACEYISPFICIVHLCS